MIKGKRGWVLIVEAVIAVLILFGFLFTALSKQTQQSGIMDKEKYFYNIASDFAIMAEKGDSIRQYINNNECGLIETELGQINEKVDINVSIENEFGNICGPGTIPQEKEIYTSEIILATNLITYETKKLKIFIWEKNDL